MKKFMILFTVLAMFFLVSCGGNSKDGDKTDTGDTTVDTGDTDTEPTDTGDTDTSEPTNPADPTDDPTEPEEGGSWEAKYKKADEHAEKVSEDVVKANNDLGMKMFSKLAAAEAGKNMMISPLSISIAMAMSTNGATDENLEEMKDVLGFGEMELGDVNEQFKHLIASLVEADKDLVLEIANSLWMREDYSLDVKTAFTDVLQEFYDAEVFAEGFTVETSTHGFPKKPTEKLRK